MNIELQLGHEFLNTLPNGSGKVSRMVTIPGRASGQLPPDERRNAINNELQTIGPLRDCDCLALDRKGPGALGLFELFHEIAGSAAKRRQRLDVVRHIKGSDSAHPENISPVRSSTYRRTALLSPPSPCNNHLVTHSHPSLRSARTANPISIPSFAEKSKKIAERTCQAVDSKRRPAKTPRQTPPLLTLSRTPLRPCLPVFTCFLRTQALRAQALPALPAPTRAARAQTGAPARNDTITCIATTAHPRFVHAAEPLPPEQGTPLRSAARDYLPALTGLRFLLALWVILHHIAGKGMMLEAWANSLPPAAKSLVLGGYLAVQTFFILSGFVLARSYAGSTWSSKDLKSYFAARFARIYPVYALSLLVVSPFIFDSLMRPTRTLAHKTGLLLTYAFVLQGWFGNLGVGWNTPAWTLSCEFFFYLFFPLLFLGLRKAGKPVLYGVLALGLALPTILAHAGMPFTWKPIIHSADFASGIAAARLFELGGWKFLRNRASLLYIPALILGALLIIDPSVMYVANYRGWGGDLNTGLRPLNVIALLGLALGSGYGARLLASRWYEYLGRASYSMYILHVPVLWWYSKMAMRQTVMPRTVAAAFYFAVVILVSILAFELVEKPANTWLRRNVKRRLA